MLFAVLSGFALAALAPFVHRIAGARAGWILAILPAMLTVYFATLLLGLGSGDTVLQSTPWLPQIDAALSFRGDGLSLTFAVLISGIGTLIIIYSGGYLSGHHHQGRFFSFMLMFMASMLGLVLADNIIALFVFWELTSITSFLLIGFDHLRAAARRAAVQALVVTGGGGLVLMAGLILMAQIGGSWELSVLLERGDVLKAHALYPLMLVLVLGGAFTKSAQVPFHFWLPNAMEAPTPVSAYLHSATMVKAGVYLLMRLNPSLGDTELWATILPLFGGATLLAGTFLSLRQTDLKLLLAYTTVASLGLLIMLTGIGSDYALEAAAAYLVAHSLFKGALFMVAGAIDHETGTRDVRRLAGLRKAMPLTFTIAMLAALSMGGLPPFVGFVAKEVIYSATLGLNVLATVVAVVASAMMFAAGFAVAWRPFMGEAVPTPKSPHEAPPSLWLGPGLLAVLGLIFGLAIGAFGTIFAQPTMSAIAGVEMSSDLVLWHGINAELMLSLLTVALGIAIFMGLDKVRESFAEILRIIGWGPDRGYDQVMALINQGSVRITQSIQPGLLRIYMLVTFSVFAVTMVAPFVFGIVTPAAPGFAAAFDPSRFYEVAIMVLIVGGALSLVFARTRLLAILMLGIQGVGIALIFMLFGAPDLSYTQFMVEILSVVVLTLVMTRLKLDAVDHRSRQQRFLDGSIAGGSAVGIGLLLMGVTSYPFDSRLSDFFVEKSVPVAQGGNIVNVILVDFRGLDTLGEITVVLIAGVAVTALIGLRARGGRKGVD